MLNLLIICTADTKGMDKALAGNEMALNLWKVGSKFIKRKICRSVLWDLFNSNYYN